MLCLSRKWTESITLTLPNGETIVVTLRRARSGGASIGIEAPKDVEIARTEIKREKEAA